MMETLWIQGRCWPEAAIPIKCCQCGHYVMREYQTADVMDCLHTIPVADRPPEPKWCGREALCPRCYMDDRRPDGTRRGGDRCRKASPTSKVGDHYLESGSSDDNKVRAMEEAISMNGESLV